MNSFTPYAIPFFLSALVPVLLAIFSWKLRQFKGIFAFYLVLLLGGSWALVSGLDTLTADPSLKLFYMQMKITTGALVPVCWLLVTFTLVGKRYLLKGYWVALMMVIPLVSIGLAWTITYHTLLRYDFSVDMNHLFPVIVFKNGPWWFVHIFYGYLISAGSVAILISALRDSRSLYGRQAITLLICIIIPAIPEVLFSMLVSPVPGFNFTPATYSIICVLLGWALYRYQLFDLAPIARDTLIETIQDLMLVFDTNNRLVDFNPAARQNPDLQFGLSLGNPMEQVFAAYPELLKASLDDGLEKYEIETSTNGVTNFYNLEVTHLTINHAYGSLGRLFLLRNTTVEKNATEELRLANEQLQNKLVEIEQLQTILRDEAVRDRLTGLYNRRYLDETLQREVARVERSGGKLSVVMLDIDHFKNVNDNFGHKSGDVMLQHLGRMLQAYIRSSDIACRYGGEEFALVLPGMTMAKTYQRIEELRHAFEKLELNCGEATLQATFSAGIAIYPDHAATGEDLLHLADQALYQAKTAGRNCVKVYESPYPFTFTRYPKTENLVKVKELTFLK
jgi:diguanylate cyclase (GGDEF)-like protein